MDTKPGLKSTENTATPAAHGNAGKELHNVVVVTPERKLFQIKVANEDSAKSSTPTPGSTARATDYVRGDYYEIVRPAKTDAPTRLVTGLAGENGEGKEGEEGEGPPITGMAFGILPLREDPTPANGSSYLINARRLHSKNVWSAGTWNQPPKLRFRAIPEAPFSGPDIVVATETGLRRVNLAQGQDLDLQDHPSIWRLLRNGCVVGRVEVDGVPTHLVNISAFGESKDTDANAPGELTGTWDFKWPRRSRIRVKLEGKSVPGELRAEVEKTIRGLAAQWLADKPGAGVPGRLSFDFVANDEPEYDALVNFDPLEGGEDADEDERLPWSDLGTYCQRRPLGGPTSRVGHPPGIRDEAGSPIGKNEYFASKAFRHIVLHEFGHILGLAHLNQHPHLDRFPMRRAAQLASKIHQSLGLAVDEAFVVRNFVLAWPDSKYSDWPRLNSRNPASYDNHIMNALPLAGAFSGPSVSVVYKEALDDADREWLYSMYER